ncbi:MAG: T9SS type A sorting domain-containing protein [Bacteroidia bacterium]|nr:T9SS type A sorting domain-containing protein [Bacteroidia bacterium]
MKLRNTTIPSLNVRWKLMMGIAGLCLVILAGIVSVVETTATENCTNGIDDDGDSLVDCDDPDCENTWGCLVIPIGILEETETWSGSGYGPYTTSTAGGDITVTASVTVAGNANFSATPSGTFGSSSFWQRSIQGTTSFETLITWDKNPESGTSDIDNVSDDKGSGVLTFSFSETVKNPVLHIDRIGGWGNTTSSSAKFTVTTPGVTLVRITGTNAFEVTSSTFFRTPDITTTTQGEAYMSANKGTAAGTIVLKGTFSSVSFSYTGVGVEGTGGDGIEFIWSLDSGSALLPVEWLGAAAEWDGEDARIFWQTAAELNSDFFEIERKREQEKKFEVIHKVPAAGLSQSTRNYEFRDMGIARNARGSDVFYRIKQVDMDGKSTYSSLIELFSPRETREITIFPNPASTQVNIQVSSQMEEPGFIVITGINGQKVWEGMATSGKNTELNISGWAKGIYTVRYNSGQNVHTASLVVR